MNKLDSIIPLLPPQSPNPPIRGTLRWIWGFRTEPLVLIYFLCMAVYVVLKEHGFLSTHTHTAE